jgi:hypothetical protein
MHRQSGRVVFGLNQRGSISWRTAVRVDQGHRSESIFEVAELEPLKRVCFKGVSAPYRSLYEFEDVSSSTRIGFSFELEILEGRLRPFEKLIRIAVQDGARRTVRKLKLLIEKEMLDHGE